MTRKLFGVVALIGLIHVVTVGQSKDEAQPFMGTWKLNVEKSKFTPGPAPKSQTLTWKPSATGFDFTFETVNAQGQPVQGQASGTMDGKEYAAKGSTGPLTRSTRRIDPYTYEETDNSADGKIKIKRRAIISKDGKTMTVTTTGMNAQGQVNSVTVYEKQ